MRKLKVLLLACLLALGTFAVAGPAVVSATCSEGQIIVAQNTNGGGGTKTFCFSTDRYNLASISGPCNFGSSWNDCISSVRVNGGPNAFVCLWVYAGYTGNGLRIVGPYPANQSTWYNLPSWIADATSSIEWGSNCLTD